MNCFCSQGLNNIYIIISLYTQRQKLKELFENHVEQWQSSAIDYDANVSYWKADDMILAEYSVIYQYADGTEYGELLDFAIEG